MRFTRADALYGPTLPTNLHHVENRQTEEKTEEEITWYPDLPTPTGRWEGQLFFASRTTRAVSDAWGYMGTLQAVR